jgi:exodeoxyribonuclease VII small subunit
MDPHRLLSPTPDSGAAPEKFEVLLGRLEEIVGEMENGEMPLEKLLQSYEEGMRLVKACADRLADAEQKVEILSRAVPPETPKTAAPSPGVAPGAPGTVPPGTSDTLPAAGPEEEIRLF